MSHKVIPISHGIKIKEGRMSYKIIPIAHGILVKEVMKQDADSKIILPEKGLSVLNTSTQQRQEVGRTGLEYLEVVAIGKELEGKIDLQPGDRVLPHKMAEFAFVDASRFTDGAIKETYCLLEPRHIAFIIRKEEAKEVANV